MQLNKDFIADAAAELGVDRSFVEKDWYAVQVIKAVVEIDNENYTPVFSGGTSLSKAHKLIKRFSEDIDFRVLCSENLKNSENKRKRSLFKKEVISAIGRVEGIVIDEKSIEAGNENRFFKIPLKYDGLFDIPFYLRQDLVVEFSFTSPRAQTEKMDISSFICELRKNKNETSALCVSPVEIAADKLSALTWRVLKRDRRSESDDPAIIRHLHDLCALRSIIVNDISTFYDLLENSFNGDQETSKRFTGKSLKDSMYGALELLKSDALYEEEYEQFVENMSYADVDEQIRFETGMHFLEILITQPL